jgi:hypothetical protein
VDKTPAPEAERKTKVAEEPYEKASEQFSQGKYGEAQAIIDPWVVHNPRNELANRLQTKTKEALRIRGVYDLQMNEKMYDQALEAAWELEKINPDDPNLSQMRAAAKNKKRSARATLNIWRLGETTPLLLDDNPLPTTAGELVNHRIPAGRHKLELNGTRTFGPTQDFIDGQSYTFVYDADKFIRLMEAGDADLREKRKLREEPRMWRAEHSHRLGKCEGELVINGFQVEYRPDRPDQQKDRIKWPFSSLKLSVDNRDLELVNASTNKIEKFKVADSNQAKRLKEFWERLDKLGR